MWPPSTVAQPDRSKATVAWFILLVGFVGYILYLGTNARAMRNHPPVKILVKEEPFQFPDVVFCPAPGEGCGLEDAKRCARDMDIRFSELQGFMVDDDLFPPTPAPTLAPISPPTQAPTPTPTTLAPTLVPTPAVTPAPTLEPTTLAPTPVPTLSPMTSKAPPFLTQSPVTSMPTASPTASPEALPFIRVKSQTTAEEWCARANLSDLTIDSTGIDAGRVRSLHVSLYVLWNDEFASTSVSSLRSFIGMFFVDDDTPLNETVVSARLPYDRVNISGTEPFTFRSNDVTVSLSQYVPIDASGRPASTERTFSQVSTSGSHTLSLNNFKGENHDGALLFVTFNVNKFSYQSIEEVDPVDLATLLGSAGGMWEIICVVFAVLFVGIQGTRSDKKWVFRKTANQRAPNSAVNQNQAGTCSGCYCLHRVRTRSLPRRRAPVTSFTDDDQATFD